MRYLETFFWLLPPFFYKKYAVARSILFLKSSIAQHPPPIARRRSSAAPYHPFSTYRQFAFELRCSIFDPEDSSLRLGAPYPRRNFSRTMALCGATHFDLHFILKTKLDLVILRFALTITAISETPYRPSYLINNCKYFSELSHYFILSR